MVVSSFNHVWKRLAAGWQQGSLAEDDRPVASADDNLTAAIAVLSTDDEYSGCRLLEISHDELGVIFDGLADPWHPLYAVALSSTCKRLRTPMRAALEVLAEQHERAMKLRHGNRWRSTPLLLHIPLSRPGEQPDFNLLPAHLCRTPLDAFDTPGPPVDAFGNLDLNSAGSAGWVQWGDEFHFLGHTAGARR